MYYLAEKYLFSTIPELIHYHQHNAAGKRAGFPRAEVLEGSKWMVSCFINVEVLMPLRVICLTGLITRLRRPVSLAPSSSLDIADSAKGKEV